MSRGIERVLHLGEERRRSRVPHPLEQRRAQPAVAVLAGERAAELRGERRSPRRGSRRTRLRASRRRRTSTSGFTCTCESPAWPKMTPRTPWRASISRTPRTYCGRRSGGTAASSMNCIDLSEGDEPGEDRARGVPQRPEPRLVLRAQRDRTRASRRDVTRAPAPSRVAVAVAAAAITRLDLDQQHRLARARRSATGAGPPRAHVDERAVEQLARARAADPRARGAVHRLLERRELGDEAARRAGERRERELDARRRARAFPRSRRADRPARRSARSRRARTRTNPSARPGARARAPATRGSPECAVGEEALDRRHVRQRRAALNAARAIRRRRRSRAPSPTRASRRSAACARRRRSSPPFRRSCRTPHSTGRRGKRSFCARAVSFTAPRSAPGPTITRRRSTSTRSIRVEAAQVDDHARTHRAAGHAAPGAARDERRTTRRRPAHEGRRRRPRRREPPPRRGSRARSPLPRRTPRARRRRRETLPRNPSGFTPATLPRSAPVDKPLTSPSSCSMESEVPLRHVGPLIKIETDRRLGHEWDEWDGGALDNGGDFTCARATLLRIHRRRAFFSSRCSPRWPCTCWRRASRSSRDGFQSPST